MMLMKKGKSVGSKGGPLKKKGRVGGCRGEGAVPPRGEAMRTKKEVHRHKWRWISIKIK